jgi:hypothetical protein
MEKESEPYNVVPGPGLPLIDITLEIIAIRAALESQWRHAFRLIRARAARRQDFGPEPAAARSSDCK